MDTHTTAMIAALVALLLLSAFFSATETAFSSLSKIRIKHLASGGNRRAALVLSMTERYDTILSTTLIGNNIVNILSASLATILFVQYFGDIGVTLSTAVMTVLVLIFGEISPKSLAKEMPESFAMFAAPFLHALTILCTPLNFLFSKWKSLLSKVFKVKEQPKMTQDELLVFVDEVTQEGSIGANEGELLRSALEFTDRTAEEILTPRIDLEALPDDATREEIANTFANSLYSRILIYHDTIDNIIGVLHIKSFYTAGGMTDQPLEQIMTRPVFVPQTVKISDLLKLLQKNKSHIAVVNDEYGGTLGIVSVEDILEELVGEIWDEHDEVIETFTKLSDHQYKVNCSGDLEDFFRFFSLPENDEISSTTVSGWVMEMLGKIPAPGDCFSYENLRITVTAVEERRVETIEVETIPKASAPA